MSAFSKRQQQLAFFDRWCEARIRHLRTELFPRYTHTTSYDPELNELATDLHEYQCEVLTGLSSTRLSRQERLQGLADHGCDTWEEYRSER